MRRRGPLGKTWAGSATPLVLGAFVVALPTPLLGQRTVQISSSDGFLLSGEYYAPPQPGPGILLLHQCNRRGPRTGLEGLAVALGDAGLHVLMLDSRGFGESRNDRYRNYRDQMSSIEPRMDDDAEAAYRFLEAQPGVTAGDMGVLGASCGTRLAIRLGKTHEALRTFVFLSGAYDTMEELRDDYRPVTDRPALVIYSEDDGYGTPESMRAVFAQAEHPASRLYVYKGDAHGADLFDQDATLVSSIVQWFRTRLAQRP